MLKFFCHYLIYENVAFLLYIRIKDKSLFQVSNTLPVDVNNTKLATVSNGPNGDIRAFKYHCLGLCTKTVGCLLACYNGTYFFQFL